MTDVTWTGSYMRALDGLKLAGDLMEDRRTREAMVQLAKARAEITAVELWVLEAKK